MAVDGYDFSGFERRWQRHWEEVGLFRCDTASEKPKYYCLNMFPYPSGDLHVGHGRNYIIGDTLVRYRLMKGYEVLSPMGWDAFGLPAENAAIKRDIHPSKWTQLNIGKMKEQFARWGVGYDWSRELSTCDPEYYKWTQWVFCRLMDAGLVYRKAAPVNWCGGTCQTVLANEQVEDGKCERCGAPVTKRNLEQWFVRITSYAQRLLDALDRLPGWPAQVKNIQRAHIGRSEGAIVAFKLAETGQDVPCFTTRPDTLWGVTYFCVAPEHPVAEVALQRADAARKAEITAFRERVKRQTTVQREQEKEGVFTGLHVVNPVNGERVPVWLANYVLMEYGTGALMAVPAHDERDHEFAKKQGIPIRVVIVADGKDAATTPQPFTEVGTMTASAQFDGTRSDAGIGEVIAWLEQEQKGIRSIQYRLHDWCISRQRYWGAPVPVVHCPACGPVRVPDEQLPVVLPEVKDFKPKGRSVLESIPEFVNTSCPRCQGPAKRDPDTLDTFVDSAWYFLRYPSPGERQRAFDKAIVDRWLPVDQYVGGREHARGHLLYSRFIVKALHDLGELSFDEPFEKLFCQGMIGMISYWSPKHGWVSWKDVEERPDAPVEWWEVDGNRTPFPKGSAPPPGAKKVGGMGGPGGKAAPDTMYHKDGSPLFADYFKMSKTRLNLVSASEMGERWGVDTQRVYTLAVGPAELDAAWDSNEATGPVRGYHKFVTQVFEKTVALAPRAAPLEASLDPRKLEPGLAPAAVEGAWKDLRRKAHETINRVTRGLELDDEGNFGFHTAISAMIELKNVLDVPEGTLSPAEQACLREVLEVLVRLMAPFAPHVAEELWQRHLGHEGQTVFRAAWPVADPEALRQDQVEIAVQLRGKVRAKAMVPPDAGEEVVGPIVLALPKVQEELAGKPVKKLVVVRNRLVNIVF